MNPEQRGDEYLSDPAFQSVLVSCLETLERGERLDREALLLAHPTHAEALGEFLADQAMLKDVASLLRDSLSQEHLGGVRQHSLNETIDSTPRLDRISIGKHIRYVGEYEILEEIARGGMGVVFKAKQRKLNRIVALKMILAGSLADGDDIERFYREARAAGRLKHPNIVPVHEIGEHEGRHYFTMDFVDGKSLADQIRDESLPPQSAAEIVRATADAVQFAHTQGTVHRDLKPANILVTQNGSPHITDFGLAKMLETVDEESGSELTATGQILGTPSYMSPEQASGKQELVGPASDIYSLGAILYACLTGRKPFVANSPVETLLQVMDQEPVAIRELNPSVPKDLETICLKCLHKEPHKRYGTAKDLADDLQRFIEGRPVLARPVGRLAQLERWSKRNPIIASLTAISALLLISGTAFTSYFAIQANIRADSEKAARQYAQEQEEIAEAALAKTQVALTRVEEARSAIQIERDIAVKAQREEARQRQRADKEKKRAQWQTYVARLLPMRQAWLEQEFGHLDQLLQQSIPSPGEPDFRGWEWFYFQDQVRQASRRIGNHRDFIGIFKYDVSQNRILAAIDDDHWELWNPSTNRLISKLTLKDCRPKTVEFSPDGRKVAWGTWDCRLRILDMETQKLLHDIDAHPEDYAPGQWMGDVAWSPSNDQIVSASYAGGIKVWNVASGELVRQLQQAESSKDNVTENATLCLDWHDQGGIAWGQRNGRVRVWESNLDNMRWERKFGSMWPSVVQWNPSGTRLLFAGKQTVIFDRDGNQLIDFPETGGAALAAWVGDDQVAYAGSNQDVRIYDFGQSAEVKSFHMHSGRIESLSQSGTGNLLTGASDGTLRSMQIDSVLQTAQVISAHPPREVWGLSWDSTGERIATAGRGDANPKIWNAVTGEMERELRGHKQAALHLAWKNGQDQLVSSDGENILLWKAKSGELINQFHLPGDATLRHFGWSLAWHPTSDSVAIGSGNVKILNATITETLAENKARSYALRPVFSPDGQHVGAVSPALTVVFNAESGKTQFVEKKRDGAGGGGAAWSPDGRFFAAGGDRIQIFDTQSYEEIRALIGHRGEVRDLQFDPHGQRLASIGGDDFLIIWDAATGEMLLRFPVLDAKGLERLDWSPDGRRIALTTSAGKLWIWGSPEMAEMPSEIDLLEDGVFTSAETDQEKLTKLEQQLDSRPNDLVTMNQRFVLLQRLQQWESAFLAVTEILELNPNDTWSPAQALVLAKLIANDEVVKRYTDSTLELLKRDDVSDVNKADIALALALVPQFIPDMNLLVETARPMAEQETTWYGQRSLLLALLRSKQTDEFRQLLEPFRSHTDDQRASFVLLLEILEHCQNDEKPEARKKLELLRPVLRRTLESSTSRYKDRMVMICLEREVQKFLYEDTSPDPSKQSE